MKNPTVLIYMDKWIASTNGMPADCRAWYFDLLVHQYDKGSIPKNIDELAGICRVRPSEYNRFEQVLKQMLGQVPEQVVEQVVKQKFKVTSEDTYVNEVASEILKKQERFSEKREKSGNIGYIIKLAKSIKHLKDNELKALKFLLYNTVPDVFDKLKNKQVLKQVLEQVLHQMVKQMLIAKNKVTYPDLKIDPYIINIIKDISNNNTGITSINTNTSTQVPTVEKRKSDFSDLVKKFEEKYSKELCDDFFNYWTEKNPDGKKMRFEMEKVFDVSRRLATWKKNEKRFNGKSKSKIDIDSIDHHAES